ncbi:BolA family protein [Leptolyngbya sp. PCC 6406]|uniref:BolA family protein n=1 Tax=Leptolyngbya sp. PCC 6406 TaxID=1173264 RepID=UPI0002AC2ED8|nr:BolA/IbaG family iron-sulfur metabolism protein [Leptolyngbya sp. PCC 6406]
MVSSEQVVSMIQNGLSEAQVHVNDLTGGGDHFEVTVISADFEGRSLVQQHQMVYRAVQEAMSSEAIHALALKTYTPQTWAATGATANA